MNVIVINKDKMEAKYFVVGTDACKYMNISSDTLTNWHKKGEIYHNNKYIVCFDVEYIKAKSMARDDIGNLQRK